MVFGLDETLVHCITDNMESADKVVDIPLNTGETVKVPMNISSFIDWN